MNRQEFLNELKQGLKGLPKEEAEERIGFYNEIIDDKIEEGLSEETAILEIGDVKEIVNQIVYEFPLAKLVKEKVKPKRKPSVLEIVLLVLGSPLWLSVLLAVFSVVFSVYVSLWSVVVCFWSTFIALLGTAAGGMVWGIISLFNNNAVIGVVVIGLAVFCLGLSIFIFYGSKFATKGMVIFTKKIGLALKNALIKKEAI